MIFGLLQGVDLRFGLVLVAVYALALLCAIIPHEVAHGWVAWKCGDPSAKMSGRLSLNPARHIDPFGLLSFIVIGVGWARPVPVNPFNYRNFKKANFWVSIAGVIVNLVIGFLASAALFFLSKTPWVNNMGLYMLYYFCYLTVVINISLLVFNLLPIYPLDGFNMLVSFTRPNNSYMQFMRQNSQWMLLVIMMVVIFTGIIENIRDFIIHVFMEFWALCFFWI
jgi:Zn-dependent protease